MAISCFFIAVECPTFRNPSAQAKADLRVLPNRRGNGLDEERLRLLERLCAERASAEEPELILHKSILLLLNGFEFALEVFLLFELFL